MESFQRDWVILDRVEKFLSFYIKMIIFFVFRRIGLVCGKHVSAKVQAIDEIHHWNVVSPRFTISSIYYNFV